RSPHRTSHPRAAASRSKTSTSRRPTASRSRPGTWPPTATPRSFCCHGAGTARVSTLANAEVLHGCGYGVLMVDARGRGDSGGLPMELGWFGEQDVRAGVDALAQRYERIGLVGLSMGGEQALTAAAHDERVRVAVAAGVGVRTAADG